MSNNLINTNIPMPNFVGGERPSANKFNAFFSYLNYKLMYVGYAIGDLYGSNSDSLPSNKWGYNYSTNVLSVDAADKRDIDIISIANLIGPSSNLNPRLINQSTYTIENEVIPSGVSEYNLKAAFGVVTNITIPAYIRKVTLSALSDNNDYFLNVFTNVLYFYKTTITNLNIEYTCFNLANNGLSHNSFSFNVIPDPNAFEVYDKTQDPNYFLDISLNAQDSSYTITLPTIGAQQSNAFNTVIGASVILDSTNPNFQKQIKLPKNIIEYYSANLETPIPSNLIVLKCYTTGEIFKDAIYYYVDDETIRVENLNIDPECLANDNFVLITNGTNITASIDDLNVKFAKHTHDGSLGESKVSIKHIADIFSNQDETKKYFPSTAIAMNWMPQYLHRNGWSLDCDNLNDDNVMRGHLVLNQGLAVYFKKPENENEINEAPRILNSELLNTQLFNILATGYIFNIVMSEDINIVSSKNLKLQGDISAKLYSNSASEFVNVNSSAVTLKHNTQIDIITDQVNYSNYTSETIVNENFTNGVSITYTASNVQTPIDNDNIRIAKQENIKINAREPVEVNKLYYNTGSSNDYIVQNENNLPPVPLTNADNRSGKLRSETTKTIIINCIPTIVDNSLSNPNSPTRPKHFIPMGEISENGFFDTLLPLGYSGDLNYQFATLAYGISSNHLLNIINFQNILRQKLETKTIPWNANDNKYDDFLTTNGLKFALIKRGKGLSTYEHAGYDPETLNFEVNSELVKLDTTDSNHRDHILDYVKLNHGQTSDSIVKSVRKKLAIADKFYEADLVYMGVKPESHGKAYNDLTADDLDNSIEIRYLELKEFQSMIHNFSVSNGNNKVPFLLPEFVWNLFSPAYYNVQSLPQIARLTKTHWFKESFPIVRINSAKTNIINIDHAHNVDYLNELQFRLCLQRYPILNNPYFNKRIGKILSNRYGHNLYRTQLLTTYIDVDHSLLKSDTSYNYEININSELAALPYNEDPYGTYYLGSFEDKRNNGNEGEDYDNPAPNRTYALNAGAYRRFYSQNASSSDRNMQISRVSSTTEGRVVYEGPAVKLIVKDVDHYVISAIPVGMFNDGARNLLLHSMNDDVTSPLQHGANLIRKTYRLGFKNETSIYNCESYTDTTSSDKYNGIFFYNYTSGGMLDNFNVPMNTPTSNLYIMTNSNVLTNRENEDNVDYYQQDTNEQDFNDEGTDTEPITNQTRRIPAYACLNNLKDVYNYVKDGSDKVYSTNYSWKSVVLTNTTNLSIKVSVKEEYVLSYDNLTSQMVSNLADLKADTEEDSSPESFAIYAGTIGKLNINPQGLRKVKVAYIETNNEVYYKESSHSEIHTADSCVASVETGILTKNGDVEKTEENLSEVLGGDTGSWRSRDRWGRNKFGMFTTFRTIRKHYAEKWFGKSTFSSDGADWGDYLFTQGFNENDKEE